MLESYLELSFVLRKNEMATVVGGGRGRWWLEKKRRGLAWQCSGGGEEWLMGVRAGDGE